MPAPNRTSLNLADGVARLHPSADTPTQRSADLVAMHDAVDRACPDRALELADAADPRRTDRAELDWVRCRAFWEQSRWDEVRRLAASVPPGEDCRPAHLRVLVRAAWTDLLRAERKGRFARVVDRLRPRITGSGSLEHTADLAHLDAWRALVYDDDLARATQEIRLAASLYHRLAERGAEVKARVFCVRVLAIEGRLAAAAEEAGHAVDTARHAGHPRLLVQALNAAATVAWRRGDWDEASATYEQALRLAEELDDSRQRRAIEANRARLFAFRGELDTAAEILDRLVTDAGREACTIAAVIDEYRGQLELLRGRPAAALERFERCLARLAEDGVQSYERAQALLRQAEALLAMDEVDRADACVDRGLDRLRSCERALERGHLLHLRALCRRRQGRPAEAARVFDEAVAELRRTGDRWALLRCLLDRGASGVADPDGAVTDATEALALAGHLRRPDLQDRARAQLARAETRLHRSGIGVEEPGEGDFVAVAPAMRALRAEARIAGASDHPVLLLGETGTGKEVLARFLHECSDRRDGPFVAVNCAAVPESLFEREFFGHARGAFTGADRQSGGLVEEAASGTLFLDEVGELPPALQPKLLRLLCEGTYRRVGESRPRRVDLRVVSATNRPLRDAVQRGRFRDDLFYRLGWFELQLPPLRERTEDLVVLARRFLRQQARPGEEIGVEAGVWRALRRYAWPGNVRELESAIGSALVRARPGGLIRTEHLPPTVRSAPAVAPAARLDLPRAVRRTERELILEALGRSRFCRTEAARLLGIGRNTLYEKMKRLGIRPEPAAREAG